MDEASSARVALTLNQVYGHTRLMVLKGGLAAWKDAGYPVVEGGD